MYGESEPAQTAAVQNGTAESMKPFGKAAQADFLLERDFSHLNHGSFGATPIPVMAQAQKWREHIETQPSRFMKVELPGLLRQSAGVLGDAFGAKGDDIVFLDNATTAINAVLRSLVLFPGDEVITTSLTYGAVMRTLEFVCARAEARLNIVSIPFPLDGPHEILERLNDTISPRTRLVVVDHVTSKTALVMPLEEIIADCTDRGIPVLVDGAHAPGMLPLALDALGATWYTGNCHKWVGAPRGSAFLWADPARQPNLRPTTISHHVADGFVPAFDWPGTKDFAPYLSMQAALDFRAGYGEERIRDYCCGLALEAGPRLAEALGTQVGTPRSMTGFMTTVALPSSFGKAKQDNAEAIRMRLRDEHRVEVDLQAIEGRLWMRLSLYLYNTLDDIDRLANAVKALQTG